MKILISITLLLSILNKSISQTFIIGSSNLISYKSGTIGDSKMRLKTGENLVVGFHRYYVEVTIIGKSVAQTLLGVTEKEMGNFLQVADYDFENDGTSEIVITYGDGFSEMTVIVFKKIKTQYEEIARLEGQKKCQLSYRKITLPYGTQGLYSAYKLENGKFIQVQ